MLGVEKEIRRVCGGGFAERLFNAVGGTKGAGSIGWRGVLEANEEQI